MGNNEQRTYDARTVISFSILKQGRQASMEDRALVGVNWSKMLIPNAAGMEFGLINFKKVLCFCPGTKT